MFRSFRGRGSLTSYEGRGSPTSFGGSGSLICRLLLDTPVGRLLLGYPRLLVQYLVLLGQPLLSRQLVYDRWNLHDRMRLLVTKGGKDPSEDMENENKLGGGANGGTKE